jgi:hypothetical protein
MTLNYRRFVDEHENSTLPRQLLPQKVIKLENFPTTFAIECFALFCLFPTKVERWQQLGYSGKAIGLFCQEIFERG